MHTFILIEDDEYKAYQCNRPAHFVMIAGTHVLIYCSVGHLIKGHVYESKEKALEVKNRLERWIDL